MTFNNYLLTLAGLECMLFINELSTTSFGSDSRFALIGTLEVHEDFVLVRDELTGVATAVRISDIKLIEPCFDEDLDEDDDEEDLKDDLFLRFERFYKDFKGE